MWPLPAARYPLQNIRQVFQEFELSPGDLAVAVDTNFSIPVIIRSVEPLTPLCAPTSAQTALPFSSSRGIPSLFKFSTPFQGIKGETTRWNEMARFYFRSTNSSSTIFLEIFEYTYACLKAPSSLSI